MDIDKKYRNLYFYVLNVNDGIKIYNKILEDELNDLQENIKLLTVNDIFKIIKVKNTLNKEHELLDKKFNDIIVGYKNYNLK